MVQALADLVECAVQIAAVGAAASSERTAATTVATSVDLKLTLAAHHWRTVDTAAAAADD